MSSDLPNEGDIIEGKIVRIESYGAFCRLDSLGSRRPPQGLIHISQLVPDQRVERVDDVLTVDDIVWVKVLKVEMDPASQRWKIQLSRKDVSQDGMATDLGKEREFREQQHNELESSLTSMIGMGVALDPMADRLVMKNNSRGTTTFRGGYSLVGDDEGEPETIAEPERPELPPLGRGRGATLPAWMTQKSDGPTGARSNDESDSERNDRKKKKKSHYKDKKQSHHDKRHRKESSTSARKRSRRNDEDGDSARSVDGHSRSPRMYHDRKSKERKFLRKARDRSRSDDDIKPRSHKRRTDSGSDQNRERQRRRSRSCSTSR
jgi:predicted RNA-binding protein with RPS1 domain